MLNTNTYLKLIFSSCIFLTSIISCRNKGNINSKLSFLNNNAFPKQRFSSVKLFAIDTIDIKTFKTLESSEVFEYVGRKGISFVDSLGKPRTKLCQSYTLDSSEIESLEKLLIQQPCKDSMFLDKNCAPIYRNVFVFYDASKQSIAQLHICFKCEMAVFEPDEDYMCDFENKVDFSKFEVFVNSIKKRQ